MKNRLEDLEHVLGRRIRHYDLRHTKITDWLASGVDSHFVAKLAGHTSTRIIDTLYSHIAEDHAYMLEQAKRGIDG